MDREPGAPLTQLFQRWRAGDAQAAEQLAATVYPDLRRLAAHYLKRENQANTLQATALANEAYLRLFGGEPLDLNDRTHFFALVARQIRHLIVDHARRRRAGKRTGEQADVPLAGLEVPAPGRDDDLVSLDHELQRLEQLDFRAARVVELRFFAGLQEDEIGEALGISVATVRRDWNFARAWLAKRMGNTG